MQLAEAETANANQISLFDAFEPSATPGVDMIEVPRWDERVKLAEEKSSDRLFSLRPPVRGSCRNHQTLYQNPA